MATRTVPTMKRDLLSQEVPIRGLLSVSSERHSVARQPLAEHGGRMYVLGGPSPFKGWDAHFGPTSKPRMGKAIKTKNAIPITQLSHLLCG